MTTQVEAQSNYKFKTDSTRLVSGCSLFLMHLFLVACW